MPVLLRSVASALSDAGSYGLERSVQPSNVEGGDDGGVVRGGVGGAGEGGVGLVRIPVRVPAEKDAAAQDVGGAELVRQALGDEEVVEL